MKNEIAIGQTQELQIKKAKNQLSTVFSLIQSDEAIRLVNILKRIETDKGIEFLCSFENINWSVELIEKYSVHDKFHRTLILSGFCLLKIAKISLNSSFFPKPIKR